MMHSKKHLKVVHSAVLQPQDWLRFVQIEPFPGQWKRLKLGEKDLESLEVCIMAAPRMGSVVPETGGLRKARFSTENLSRGKSGSYRVFYVYFQQYGIVVLWAIIAKSESDNLTKLQRNAIANQIARLTGLLDRGEIQ